MTTVPLQQLFVLNSEFMVGQAKALAARLQTDEAAGDAERIRQAYRLLYGRPASEQEIAVGLAFLSAAEPTEDTSDKLTRWEQYAQALLAPTSSCSWIE